MTVIERISSQENLIESLSFEEFNSVLLSNVLNVSQQEYEALGGADKETIALVHYNLDLQPVTSESISIYLNTDKFKGGYDDCIPVTLMHEVVEVWEKLQHHEYYQGSRTYAHKQALLSEYYYAKNLGIAEKYLTLISIWSQSMRGRQRQLFLQENAAAYKRIHSGLWNPNVFST